jgi:hypothetical protein
MTYILCFGCFAFFLPLESSWPLYRCGRKPAGYRIQVIGDHTSLVFRATKLARKDQKQLPQNLKFYCGSEHNQYPLIIYFRLNVNDIGSVALE